jgi:PLP dependent protein
MAINKENYSRLKQYADSKNCTLVAVSKIKPVRDILAMYELGQRDFGENYVQELIEKYEALPKDINWHFIGHLQSNKVKYIAPFIHLVHGVDSERLLKEINKQGKKIDRTINCLLQVHIAREETKFGLDESELEALTTKIKENIFPNVNVQGLMGMGSYADDEEIIRKEFRSLHELYEQYKKIIPGFTSLSMGMSGDYETAIAEGSNMIRVGSLLFGARI